MARTIDHYPDLAGRVCLHPDRGVASSCVPEQGTEDECGSHTPVLTRRRLSHTKPTSRAMMGIRATMRIMPMTSKTTPERTILVIGIMPEP
jgi:hypothetical protein